MHAIKNQRMYVCLKAWACMYVCMYVWDFQACMFQVTKHVCMYVSND